MAQKLDADLNIIAQSDIEIQVDPMTQDLNIIQALDDEPNDVGGLTAQELKAKFDQAGNTIKTFINESLIPQVLGAEATEADRQANETQRQANETARQTAESGRVSAESGRATAEAARETAENAREAAESARQTAFEAAQTRRAEDFTASQAERAEAFTASQAEQEARFEAAEERRNAWEDYDPAKAYAPGNKVYYLGSSYVNILACTGVSPYDMDHWQIIAKKGADGEGATPYDYALSAGYEGTEAAFKQNFAQSPWLPQAGGTVTGALNVTGPLAVPVPTLDNHAATKGYADNLVNGITWGSGTFPSSAHWHSVCYGNGRFVAVAYDSDKAAYSTDGITWTETTLPSSAYWRSVCYGNGRFVAVDSGSNKAAYSTDGITWTETTLPSSAGWHSVCYGNGRFVAVADGFNKAAYSTDGITWTAATLPNTANWRSVCYGNGRFVAVAYGFNKAAYSTDGITWTAATLPSSAGWQSVCYGNGRFVAVSYGSNKAAVGTSIVSHGAIEDLDWRKLELVKVFDVTETLSEKSFWPIDVSRMHPENCTALFFFFNMPNSTSYGLALGNGTGTHIGYIYGSKAGIMAWSAHIPEMPITFIPIGNVQDFTNRTGYTFKDFKTLSLCPPSLNGKLNGTYRCLGLVIP